ncbi:SanA/YdcF family protein [Enemella sp. A6]|uniref:SanA/YdcF family protein n=1 Tax=Enemella sp. A6 TaxID=3440152 RepID=UPI003EBE1557
MTGAGGDSGRRLMRRGLAIGLALAFGGTALLAGLSLWTQRSSEGRIFDASSAPARKVALVLGAEIYRNGSPSPFLKGRLDRALELYRDGKADVLLVSGDAGDGAYNEPRGMRAYLISHGVPPEHVVEDVAGFDTYDSCVRADRIFGVRELTIVSQSYHLPRAIATCRAVGVDAIGVGDDSVRERHRRTWDYGVRREVLANLKAGWDILSRRDPVLGPPETGVQEGLATPRGN